MSERRSSRVKLFLENMLVYGLGGVLNKMVPFIMLPIITRLYPETEYIGYNDLVTALVTIASSIAVCGMYDAMFRLFFDKTDNNYQIGVCSTSLLFVIATGSIAVFILFLFKDTLAKLYFGGENFEILIYIVILNSIFSAINTIVQAPTRMNNQRKVFLVTNTISPLIAYCVALILILRGRYLVAMPLGETISALILVVVFWTLNNKYFDIGKFDFSLLKKLLFIGLPLMPNFIIFWIYNSADRVMITSLLGANYTGVYSVASKVGQISNLIYCAFSGGWLYFAYSTMNDRDQIQMKSNVFEYLGVISFMSTVGLTSISKLAFGLLFPEEYHGGFLIAPYLFIAPLLMMLYQVIGNQFTIHKKSYLNLLSLLTGAIVNVVLNLKLIPRLGIEGAALATVLGYITTLVVCALVLSALGLIVINKKVYLNVVVLLIYFILWRGLFSENICMTILLSLATEVVYVLFYRKELVTMIRKVFK